MEIARARRRLGRAPGDGMQALFELDRREGVERLEAWPSEADRILARRSAWLDCWLRARRPATTRPTRTARTASCTAPTRWAGPPPPPSAAPTTCASTASGAPCPSPAGPSHRGGHRESRPARPRRARARPPRHRARADAADLAAAAVDLPQPRRRAAAGRGRRAPAVGALQAPRRDPLQDRQGHPRAGLQGPRRRDQAPEAVLLPPAQHQAARGRPRTGPALPRGRRLLVRPAAPAAAGRVHVPRARGQGARVRPLRAAVALALRRLVGRHAHVVHRRPAQRHRAQAAAARVRHRLQPRLRRPDAGLGLRLPAARATATTTITTASCSPPACSPWR